MTSNRITIGIVSDRQERSWVLAVIAAIAAIVVYTLLYIKRINRQQRETMEAYLSLLSESNREEAPQPEREERDEELMRRLMSFIEAHLGDSDITIDDMASAVAVSRSGLHRKVRHLLGTSPMEFLREARIRKAAHLLATTAKPVSEVAYSCGFSDPKYFSKCFKASTGKTPTEYKSQGS